MRNSRSSILLFLAAAALGQTPTSEQPLALATKVDLTDCLDGNTFRNPLGEKLAVSGNFLAGVVSPNPNSLNATVAIVDIAHGGCTTIDLGEEEFLDLAIHNSKVAVLTAAITGRGGSRIRVWDFKAQFIEEIVDQPDISQLVVVQQRLVGLTRTGLLRDVRARSHRSLDQAASTGRFLGLGLSDGGVALINRTDAAFTHDPATGRTTGRTAHRVSLDHTEVAKVKAHYATAGSAAGDPNVVITATSDENDNGYFLLSGFTAEQGAPIVVTNMMGTQRHNSSFRVPVTLGTRDRFQVPVSIAASSGRLFVLDSTGLVTVFRVPNK